MFRSYVILGALLGLALAVGIGCNDNPPANGGNGGTGGGAAGTGGSGGEAGTGGSGGEAGTGGSGGAGLTECETFGGDAECQTLADTVCVTSTCDDATCDGTEANCCVNTPVQDEPATDCSAELPPLAECVGGVCTTIPCVSNDDCEDSNDCTLPQTCDLVGGSATEGQCIPTPPDNETNGTVCDVVNGSGDGDGVCATGVCELFVCDDDLDCDDSKPCTDDTCDTSTLAGVCVFTNNDANSCTTCPGTGGASCECSAGNCVDAPLPFVCEQFNPAPAQTGQNCDGSAGQECICEKPEFIAIDCDLLANSAPLPLQASAQQFDIAFSNTPLSVLVTDVFVLPASLVCGFIDAGFTESSVANSILANDISNANLTSLIVNDFLDDTTAGGALVSPHNTVQFVFADACGDACTGSPSTCASDGSSCNATEDCPNAETGPGIQVPFFFRTTSPETVPPGPSPFLVTPGAGSSSDFEVDLDNTAIELVDLTGPITTDACIGGACATNVCSPFVLDGVCNNNSICDLANGTCDDDLSACTSDTDCLGDNTCFGSTQACTVDADCNDLFSPRIMYEATCNKIEFAGGACTPFDVFADVSDVCKVRAVDFADAPPCCDTGIGTGSGRPVDPSCNTSAANKRRCCAALAENYPDATSAQQPQLWVNE